jgi:predicted RecA/RadA family phage recombinase
MSTLTNRLIIAALLAAAASAARAQTPDTTCRNGLFATSERAIGRAQVTGSGRLYLLNDNDGCPAATAKCRGPTSVRSGAVVLTGHALGAYVCVFDAVSGDAGYAPGPRLKSLPVDPAPTLKAWIGTWRMGDDVIRLTVKGDQLSADGTAYWPSAHPSPRQNPGGPNEGELSGASRPSGARVIFADPDPQACRATLTLVQDLLVVADNQACGGMNVSFSGVYRRR